MSLLRNMLGMAHLTDVYAAKYCDLQITLTDTESWCALGLDGEGGQLDERGIFVDVEKGGRESIFLLAHELSHIELLSSGKYPPNKEETVEEEQEANKMAIEMLNALAQRIKYLRMQER